MRTDKERISALHERVLRLQDRKRINTWGTLSAGLFALLTAFIVMVDVPFQAIGSSDLSGSSLLEESAGGYVLVAVLSFAAAVCITVYCIRKKQGR
ncbi:MAG: hypothetical protein IKF68_01610 [Erysipelotrichaceae bacterium]|nr:hypothetical protein [Erysipelotrichaceae bacterium]